MSETVRQFKMMLSGLFRMEEELEIVAKWEISFAELHRMVNSGKLPDVSITFPMDDARRLDTWESIYLTSLRHGPEATIMIKPRENQAVYDMYLVKHRG